MPVQFVNVTNTHGDTQRVPANWVDLFPGQFKPVEPLTPASDLPDGEPTTDWTIAQLQAYARDHHIDVTGAHKKADYLDAIDAATPEHPTPVPVLDTTTTTETPATGDKE